MQRFMFIFIFSMALSVFQPSFATDTLQVTSPDPLLEAWRWTTVNLPKGQKTTAFCEDKNGHMWFTTNQGVWHYDGIHWTHYTKEDGLADDHVTSVMQTQDGAMWFGTWRNGISRFDPKASTWTNYNQNNGLPGNFIRGRLHLGPSGRIWAGCQVEGGINKTSWIGRFDGTNWTTIELPKETAQTSIMNILESEDGSLWVATFLQGLLHLDLAKISEPNAWTHYKKSFMPQRGKWGMGEIFQASDGNIWFAGGMNGIHCFDGKNWHAYTSSEGLPESPILMLWQTNDGTIWAGGQDVICRLDGDNWKTYDAKVIPRWINKEGGYNNSSVIEGFCASDGFIWFMNLLTNQVFRFDPKGAWTEYAYPDGLYGGYETNDGSVWFHTQKQAVQYKAGQWLGHTPSDGFLDGNTRGMVRTSDDVLWFFGMHQGVQALAQFKDERWHIFTPQDGILDNFMAAKEARGVFRFPYHLPVDAPIETADGEYWFYGQHEGQAAVCHFDGTNWTRYTTSDGLVGKNIITGYGASDGTLWFGARGSGSSDRDIIRYDGNEWMIVTDQNTPIDDVIMDFTEWPLGTLWAGTGYGLKKTNLSYLPITWQSKPLFPNSWPKVSNLLPTQDALWFGFLSARDLGVGRYDGNEWRIFTEEDGLPGNSIHDIIQSSDGAIWMTSIKGLSRYDGEDWVHYEEGLDFGWIFPEMRETRDGTFWVEDSAGKVFHFRHLSGRDVPETFLDSPVDRVSSAGNIQLVWSGSDLWDHTPPDKLKFQWRLDNKAWTHWMNRRDFTFTALPAGSHTFEVRSIDHNGNMDPTPSVHAFWVEYPWWKNPYLLIPSLFLLTLTATQTARVVRRDRRLQESYTALQDETDARNKLDAQLQHIEYLYRLRSSLSTTRLPQDVIEKTGNILIEVLPPSSGVHIQFDNQTYVFGADEKKDLREHHRPLIWAGKERGHLYIFCDIAFTNTQEHTLLDETAGQLSNTLESRELEMQLIQSARLVSMGEMAAGVAHELNQPLSVISATAGDIYQRQLEGMDIPPDRLKAMMQNVLEVITRMDATINHLRVFSRDTSDEPGVPIQINDVIHDSLKMIQAQLENHNVELILDLTEDLPLLTGHPHQLEQVIINLLANARDALDDISDQKKQITIRSLQNAQNAQIEIQDNGMGIEEEIRQHIFEPFFTTKEADKGTGLGLSISYAIVRNHNGLITCQSQKGKGTTFRVEFPVR